MDLNHTTDPCDPVTQLFGLPSKPAIPTSFLNPLVVRYSATLRSASS